MKILTYNQKIACQPFPDMSVKTSLQGSGPVKVARIENKVSLVPLKVVASAASTTDFPVQPKAIWPGDTVFIRGSHYTQPWAKEVFTVDGLEPFILVPESAVELVQREYPQAGTVSTSEPLLVDYTR